MTEPTILAELAGISLLLALAWGGYLIQNLIERIRP